MKDPLKQKKAKAPEVGIMFRGPQQLRGAIHSISAWAEMKDFRVNGKIPQDKDIWAWMAAMLYMSGEDKWPQMLKSGSEAFTQMQTQLSETDF